MRGRRHLYRKDSSCPGVMSLVVAVGQVIHSNTFMRIGRMDKLAVADIDADVRNAVLVGILEENEVTGLEQAIRDFISMVVLLGRRAREGHTVGGTENVADKAGAVEAGARSSTHDITAAAKRIRGSNDAATVDRRILSLHISQTGMAVCIGVSRASLCRKQCGCAGSECGQ